jgi:Holliday junction resolvasome RuvABC ATP-dependent DNA helicase subunit
MDYFENIVGQTALKRKLSFYIDAFETTRRIPFLLFGGAKGFGKTMFARAMAKHLTNPDGSKRQLLELNCSIIRNNQMFFENIFLQYIHGRPITVLFDECHNLPKDLSQALLTICNTEKDSVRDFSWQDATYTFDFTKISFMFATTEQDKIFPPLKDRMDIVDFDSYSKSDMKQIILNNSNETVYDDNVLDSIVNSVRGNARSCVKMAEQITTYCKKNSKAVFNKDDWKSLCHHVNILPMGLNNSELIVLRELQARGSCSLNMLASATGMSRGALQRDIEQYLMKLDLIRIDGKRKITQRGQDVLRLATSMSVA